MSDNHQDFVLLTRDAEVAIVSLNRPDRMNAVGGPVLELIEARMETCIADDSIRAVVLTGEGRAFCAGADLVGADERGAPARPLRERFPIREDSKFPQSWFGVNIPKPVVAAIKGPAVGWGAEALASCDMRIAGESARIGWVFAKRGLCTDMGVGPVMLPKIVGNSQALRLLYSGEIVNAAEALRIGLVDEVVPDDELRDRAIAVARHLAEGSPAAVRTHKAQVYGQLIQPFYEMYFDNLERFSAAMASEDFKEGVRSFMEKRPAQWTGR